MQNLGANRVYYGQLENSQFSSDKTKQEIRSIGKYSLNLFSSFLFILLE